MASNLSEGKRLYTLNQSKKSEDQHYSSDNESIEDSEIIQLTEKSDNRQNNQRLFKKNQLLLKKVYELELKNKALTESTQLSEKRNQKHQEKQRDLIKKISYFQVANKQLAYEITKIHQDLMESRQNKKHSEIQMQEVKLTIKKSMQEKDKFILLIKNLFEMLKNCDSNEDFHIEKDKILSFLSKNIGLSQNSHKIHCEFDCKFEMSRLDTLKQKAKGLEEQIQEYKSIIEKERNDKKKLISTYNDKIIKLRQMYDSLRQKVEDQQVESHERLRTITEQKNQIIQSLKQKLKEKTMKESRNRKQSIQMKKSIPNKKSFIGDGDYEHLKLDQLDSAIEDLQRKIKEFQD